MYPLVQVMCIAATQGSPISDNSACHGVSAGISPKASPLLRLTLVGLMPTLIPENSLDPESLPPVKAAHLLSYLVLDTSYYTKNQFKAFRSLKAYNQMVSGFIVSIQGHIVAKKFVVCAKERHSQ